MEYFLNQLINGLCQGAIYALMAIGYSVVVGVVGMVTFTHGEVMVMGAFAAYYVFQYCGTNLILGFIAAFAASWIMGIFVYKVCYERFFNSPRHISLLCTIGFSMLVKNLAQILFGPNQIPMLNIVNIKFYHIGAVQISSLQILIIALVISLALVLNYVFYHTKFGVKLRAVSQDKTAAYMVGINVKRVAMLGNCVGCGLGGIAGLLICIYYQVVQATMGGPLGMKAFSASVLGGLTDVRFSALGGLCIGIVENLGITFTSASYRDVFAFGFLILILIFKPTGFVTKRGTKV
ncbi:MAG: branched-chain amino acid ABC transporter permease [Sphaerochaeta sp.]|nr:branched-chain amino acid ABC transporter permease [Sphaerochaeta sp.]